MASKALVNSGGLLTLSGGLAAKTTIRTGGNVQVLDSAKASSTTISSGGLLTILSGGTASSTIVGKLGSMLVDAGGATVFGASQRFVTDLPPLGCRFFLMRPQAKGHGRDWAVSDRG